MSFRYFSTFTGIGGFEIGIQNAWLRSQDKGQAVQGSQARDSQGRTEQLHQHGAKGLSCVGYSEIDKYAIKVYERNFPNVRNYGDITKINADELPDFDCLVGGFPCQAFSIAGKRRGFEDTRGTLFFDLARILRAKQPRLFVFENVKGLLSHDNGNTFRTIIATIEELGYDCQWQVLNSKNHGVPQNRERVYIVGHLRGTPRPEVFPITGDGREATDVPGQYTNTLTARYEGAQAVGSYIANAVTTGSTHTVGSYVAESKLDAQEIRQLNNPTHSNDRIYSSDGISPTLNTMQGGNRQPFVKVPEATKKGYAEATIGQAINLSVPNSKTRRGRVSDIAPTLDTGMQVYTIDPDSDIGYNGSQDANATKTRPNKALSVLQEADSQTTLQQRGADVTTTLQEDEVLQSGVYEKSVRGELQNGQSELDDLPLQGKADIQATPSKHMRNMQEADTHRDTPQERGLAGQSAGEPTGTLSRLPHENAPNRSSKERLQETLKGQLGSVRIRRLTPLETERLQGFPDNWTAQGADGAISDTQRYKMCGNAVTTNVVQAVFERIINDY